MAQRLPVLYNKKPCYDIVFQQSFDGLWEELAELGAADKRLCIVTDSTVDGLYAAQILKFLEGKCRKAVKYVFPAGEEHKNLDTVRDVYRFLIEEGFDRKDMLLALGGGSVIDTAKAIGFGALYKGDFWDFFTGAAKIEKTLPVGVVLTISAAGSEGSDSCVITQERGNLKWGCPKTDVIRPKFAVLNPRFTCSLPAYQTASGAVDMMAHIMERYFTNTPDVGLTDRLCEALLKTVLDAAPKAIADPNDYAARADLMWAGMLAHNNSCGVGREQDWASHQIEHELSAFYDCAHGAGLAVILPAWMEYVLPHDPVRLAQFAVRVFGCEMNFADPEATARQGIEKLCLFFHSLGMPITFDELGAKAKDIPDMVAHRAEKPGGFPFGGFVKIQPADMEAILRLAAGEAQ